MRRWWPLALTLLLLAAVSAVAATSTLPIGRADEEQPPASVSQLPQDEAQSRPSPFASIPPSAETPASGPAWITDAVAIAGGVLLLGAAVTLGVALRPRARFSRRRLRRRVDTGRRLSTVAAEEEVVAALDAGLLDLDDDAVDPRRAVIACWVRLEQAAADAGVPRRLGDTPTDLVVRMLAARRLDAAALTGFADVYRRARYATHEIDPSMRDHARQALRRLRDELAVASQPQEQV